MVRREKGGGDLGKFTTQLLCRKKRKTEETQEKSEGESDGVRDRYLGQSEGAPLHNPLWSHLHPRLDFS